MGLNAQLAIGNRNKEKQFGEKSISIEERKGIENNDLLAIKGLGEGTINKLYSIGIKCKEDLLKSNIDIIKKTITSPITIGVINNFLNNK